MAAGTARMTRGELLWFNESRQDGVIRTSDGERVVVLGEAFPNGRGPVGRCAGTPVVFEVTSEGEERRATAVRFVEDEAPRRARSRSRR